MRQLGTQPRSPTNSTPALILRWAAATLLAILMAHRIGGSGPINQAAARPQTNE